MNRATLVAEFEAIQSRLNDIDPNDIPADRAEEVEADLTRSEQIEAASTPSTPEQPRSPPPAPRRSRAK